LYGVCLQLIGPYFPNGKPRNAPKDSSLVVSKKRKIQSVNAENPEDCGLKAVDDVKIKADLRLAQQRMCSAFKDAWSELKSEDDMKENVCICCCHDRYLFGFVKLTFCLLFLVQMSN
jgi:hypothetical protein